MTLGYRPARLADPEDRAFIRSTWSRAFKSSHDAGMIYTDDWAEVMHRQIDRVLDRADARALLCFDQEAPSFLYGWIAGDTSSPAWPVVFFMYVKEPYRRQGIGRSLFHRFGVDEQKPFVYVCRTPITLKLRTAEKIPLARYNPNVVRYPKERTRTWPTRT